jgi:hypothetical protein
VVVEVVVVVIVETVVVDDAVVTTVAGVALSFVPLHAVAAITHTIATVHGLTPGGR